MKYNDEIYKRIAGIGVDEINMINTYTSDFSKKKLDKFLNIYVGQRYKSSDILIYTLIGLIGIGGIQRFALKQTGMGILFILTYGLFFLGTIIDLVNHKKMTVEANEKLITEKILHLL